MSAIRERLSAIWVSMLARPAISSIVLGLIAALGYPPVHAWWIALPALAAFIALVHQAKSWKAAAWQGWLFGWAHLTLANNWIATAFTHQAQMPQFLGWVAVPLLCIYLATYPALAVLAARWITSKLAKADAGLATFGAVLAATWIVTEWLRSWVFTGYPWPPLGLMLLGGWNAPGLGWMLPFIGTYALSGFAVIVASVIALSVRRRDIWTPLFALVPLAIVMILPGRDAGATQIRYTLVQPNLTQAELNDPSQYEAMFRRIAALTRPGNDKPRLVLWPESAVPDLLEDGYPERYYRALNAGGSPEFARARIANVVGEKSTLLTGVVNLNIGTREDGTIGAVSARNSVLALSGAGEIEAHYAKAHLVPWGEYLPMREWLEPLGLNRLVAGNIDYVPGPGPGTIDLGAFGKAGVQICYEIVFSGQTVDPSNRPDYIFNPSNDGWFGKWGPPQHLAQARMRALEEGLPVLRATTTGISAVIDANGVVRGALLPGEAKRLDGFVPKAKPPTLFSQYGNAIPLTLAMLMIILALGLPRVLALRRPRG